MDLFSSILNGVHRIRESKVVEIEKTEIIDK